MRRILAIILVIATLAANACWGVVRSRGSSTRNLLHIQRRAPYALPLAKPRAAFQTPDTVYIVAFRVEFAPDSATLTTGTGQFDSDTAYYSSGAYKYDNKPHDRTYFNSHLEFLKNYYKEVSDGRLHIEYRVYPEQSQGVYSVKPKEMRDYNIWEQKDEESYCKFGLRKADSLMLFIRDAVHVADADPDGLGSPFNHPFPLDKTAYLLIHAGASAFADGGYYQSLGENARDTPADFFDFFVSQRDIQYFLNVDSIAVDNGRFAIQDLMMVSETANQDSVNFGVNGVLVNQFARQLGVPDLFGVNNECVGISAIGAFCIMDFAGYNNGSGFVPPYPSAWVRAFMGWTTPTYCPPGKDSTYEVFAASLDTTNEILQVPLNENEYLLIENRQRNLQAKPWFRIDTLDESADGHRVMGMPILDSLVETDSSSRNVVTKAKNYESGLPGSGVLIWYVDESMIRSFYEYNAINFDSSRRAIKLIEADGFQDIGVQFTNVFNTTVQDYGQPYDFFPHIRLDSNEQEINTLTRIYTNDGGLAQVQITSVTPVSEAETETMFAEGHGEAAGERIANYRSEYFSVKLTWQQDQGAWPQVCDSGAAYNHPVGMNLIDSLSGKEILVASRSGRIFAWTEQGKAIGDITDSIPIKDAKGTISQWVIRSAVADLADTLTTPSVKNDTLWVAGTGSLYRLYNAGNDSLIVDTVSLGFAPATPPMIGGDTVYLGDREGKVHLIVGTSIAATIDQDIQSAVTSMALADLNMNNTPDLVAAYANGTICSFEGTSLGWKTELSNVEEPKLCVGNIDNSTNGSKEIVVVDRQGTVVLLDSAGAFDSSVWPIHIARNNASSPGLADLDQDGYLDIIIAGTNRIHAYDRRGNFLVNWSVLLDNRHSFGEIVCSPTLADLNGDTLPDIVFAYGFENRIYTSKDTSSRHPNVDIYNPDSGYYAIGNITALTPQGSLPGSLDNLDNFSSAWPFSTSTPVVSSVFLDDIDGDGTLEMIGVSSGGWVYAWELESTTGKNARVYWHGGMANLKRTCAYADSLLPAAPSDPNSKPLEIENLYAFPNPAVQKPTVTVRYKLSRSAGEVEMVLYNSIGEHLKKQTGLTTNDSWNRYRLSISDLPPGTYRAKLVARHNGSRKVRFCKFAVIK